MQSRPTIPRVAGSATVWMILLGILASAGLVVPHVLESADHDYGRDYAIWESENQKAQEHNNFLLVLTGEKEPDEGKSDDLLALDLRRIFIEPANAVEQRESLFRLMGEQSVHYPNLSTTVRELFMAGEKRFGPQFIALIEKLQDEGSKDLLKEETIPPDKDVPKYSYDIREEVEKYITRDTLLGAWAVLSLLSALASGLFFSTGWLDWKSEDAFFKTWIVVLLFPTFILWLAAILVFGLFALPAKGVIAGFNWGRVLFEGRRLHDHPHHDRIVALRAAMQRLRKRIAASSDKPTGHLEAQLRRAQEAHDKLMALGAVAITQDVVDDAEAFLQALDDVSDQ